MNESYAKRTAALFRSNTAPLLLFFCIAVFIISKALYVPACLAFHEGDDGRPTFSALKVAYSMLGEGHLPQMNFFDNFGTPLIGDAMAHPFGIHSFTYALTAVFFPGPLAGPLAMSVNMFLLSFLTLVAAYAFFKEYFSRTIASGLAIFVFWIGGFFYWFPSHQHQAALLPFLLILLFISRYARNVMARSTFLLIVFFVTTIFILSVSINFVAAAIPLLIAAAFFMGLRASSPIKIGVDASLAIFAALVATFPHTQLFLINIADSYRGINQNFVGGDQLSFSWPNFITAISSTVSQIQVGGAVPYFFLYLSPFGVVGLLVGTYVVFLDRATRYVGWMVLLLGFLPFAAVLLLYVFPMAWEHIALVKTINVERGLMYSNVFITLAIGFFTTALVKRKLSPKIILPTYFFVLLLLLIQVGCRIAPFLLLRNCRSHSEFASWYEWGTLLFFVSIVAYYVWQKILITYQFSKVIAKHFFPQLLFVVIIFSVIPLPLWSLGFNTPFACNSLYFNSFTPTEHAGINPNAIIVKFTEPLSRIATIFDASAKGHLLSGNDHAAVEESLLGSNAMNIVMHGQFTNYLLRQKLIQLDSPRNVYHFIVPPHRSDLERLGIRYIVASQDDTRLLISQGWEELARESGWSLLESPMHPTPFYLINKNNEPIFLRSYTFSNNTASVSLPENSASATLIATFVNRPGWRVYIDGRATAHYAKDDQLIRVNVLPEERIVEFVYEPLGWGKLFVWFLAGVAIIFIAVRKEHLLKFLKLLS